MIIVKNQFSILPNRMILLSMFVIVMITLSMTKNRKYGYSQIVILLYFFLTTIQEDSVLFKPQLNLQG